MTRFIEKYEELLALQPAHMAESERRAAVVAHLEATRGKKAALNVYGQG